ncbi:2'-5' RNA ligase family protein [Pseudonocardia thermophila]|jgi:2''-5'' RNA ligase|uniref:2'-5' RNA ligase family protein n=1 Tax=Pseudonocardia thermophila TaxID=1848 RepID=UPI00248D51ED|nr:2'-5' RNA ligase family protein [Pseudonocardia thermophila]
MRLFTALVPPAEAVAQVAAALVGPAPDGWRLVDPATWHITLAFHGDVDDPAPHLAALDAAAGLPGPRLRVDGSGAFPGVRWARVVAEPRAALDALVEAVGGDAQGFVPHITVLRRRGRRRPEPRAVLPPLSGPWWQADEVLLMASELRRDGAVHRIVHRVALTRG